VLNQLEGSLICMPLYFCGIPLSVRAVSLIQSAAKPRLCFQAWLFAIVADASVIKRQ
jgi:hypothetical protein